MGGGQKKLRNPPGSRAKIHEQRIKQFQESTVPRYKHAGEAEVVAGYELSAVLRKWVTEWLKDRPLPQHLGKRATPEETFMGPIDWLSEKTEIHIRRVRGIVNGEFATVPLSDADALLQAIDRPDILAVGEIGVYPNPNWSQERWVEYMRERGCV
jgi:hypothetical protein